MFYTSFLRRLEMTYPRAQVALWKTALYLVRNHELPSLACKFLPLSAALPLGYYLQDLLQHNSIICSARYLLLCIRYTVNLIFAVQNGVL